MSRIQQNVQFPAPAKAVYDAIIDGGQFTKVSGGAEAESAPEEGASISLFGGQIVGRNIELVPGERIVQAWRSAGWDPGVYSVVRFEFESDGEETSLAFEHVGYPEGEQEHLAAGWHKMYWEPLRAYLARRGS